MYPWRSLTWSPSLSVRPHASSAATPRSSSLRFSQLLAGATIATVSPSRRRRGLRGAARSSGRSLIRDSYEKARDRVRLEQDRPVDREPFQLAGRRGRAVDDELRQDPAEDRRELVAVGGAEDDQDAGRLGQAVDDEVPVRRHRVQAGLRVDLGPEMLGQVALEEVGQAPEADLVAL